MTALVLALLCSADAWDQRVVAHDVATSAPVPVEGAFAPIGVVPATALAASVQAKLDGTVYRATFRPGVLWEKSYSRWYSESAISVTSDSSTSRTQITLTNGYDPFAVKGPRAVRLLEEAVSKHDCSEQAIAAAQCRERSCPAQEQTEKDEAVAACANRQLHAQWKAVHSGWIPSVFVTGQLDVFPGGSEPDPNAATVSRDREPFGGVGAELRLGFRPSPDVELVPYGRYQWSRPSGAPGTKLANNVGGGLTVSALVWRFETLDELLNDEQYIQTGLVPGLAAGASVQAKHCDGRERCDKGRIDEVSITPFAELRVKSEIQLRLSFVWSRYRSVTKDGVDAVPTLTIATALGGR